jgi:hypothetical protein
MNDDLATYERVANLIDKVIDDAVDDIDEFIRSKKESERSDAASAVVHVLGAWLGRLLVNANMDAEALGFVALTQIVNGIDEALFDHQCNDPKCTFAAHAERLKGLLVGLIDVIKTRQAAN